MILVNVADVATNQIMVKEGFFFFAPCLDNVVPRVNLGLKVLEGS